jgi:hypothetical protein
LKVIINLRVAEVVDAPVAGVEPKSPPAGLLPSVVEVVDAAGGAPRPNEGFEAVDEVVAVVAAGVVVAGPNRLSGLLASVGAAVVPAGEGPNNEGLGAVPEAAGAAPNNPPVFGASVAVAVAPNPPNVGFAAVAPVPAAGVVEAPNSPPLGAVVEDGAVPKSPPGFGGSVAVVFVVPVVLVVPGLPNENDGLGALVVLVALNKPVPVDEVPVVAVLVFEGVAPKPNPPNGVVDAVLPVVFVLAFVFPNKPPVVPVPPVVPKRPPEAGADDPAPELLFAGAPKLKAILQWSTGSRVFVDKRSANDHVDSTATETEPLLAETWLGHLQPGLLPSFNRLHLLNSLY